MNAETLRALAESPSLPGIFRAKKGVLAAGHVVRGLFVPKNPVPSAPDQQDPLALWCRDLLSILGVEIRARGESGGAGACLLVSNHISWMDICLLRSIFPVRFIAKEEIALWPLVGGSAREAGTLFIARRRLSSFRNILRTAQDSLEQSLPVAVFPEGTTTTGETLLPFRSGLFEICVNTGMPVLPVSIRYENGEKSSLSTVSYTGGESFARSFWRTLGEQRIVAHVSAGNLIFPEGMSRKDLARIAWERVREGLRPSRNVNRESAGIFFRNPDVI